MQTEIIKSQPISAMVDNYNAAMNECERAFDLLQSAHDRLKPFYGERYVALVDGRLSNFDLHESKSMKSRAKYRIKNDLWKEVANRLQVYSFMTEKRKKEFFEAVEKDQTPEFTIENIYGFYETFTQNVNTYLSEAINEAFEALRPHYSTHKTNTEYEVGEKAIISGYFGYASVGEYLERKLTAIDNAFHLLDGKGIAKYPNTLAALIGKQVGEHLPSGVVETEYFKVRWYDKAGTVHFKFKRLDLLAKLNAECGGNRLRNE